MNIEIRQNLRPCIVNGQKALFHCWKSVSQIVAPSHLKGGHNGGTVTHTVGIIEREDGTVHECYPDDVRFVDNAFAGISFGKADSDGN